MTHLTIGVPESRIPFFMELIEQLNFPVLNQEENELMDELMDIPQWEKEYVLEIQKKYPKSDYIDADIVDQMLKID
jgi:hypothetical protein